MKHNECPFKKLVEPKGTNGLPLVNSLPFFALKLLSFLTNIQQKYGDVSQFKLMGHTTYLINHPDNIAHVFKNEKNDTYKKNWFYKLVFPFFGNGLINSYGNDWKQQREQLQPLFKKSETSKWFPIVTEETLNQFKNIDSTKNELILDDFVKPLMQNITSRILFGLKGTNTDSKKIISALDEITARLVNHGYKSFIFNGILNKLPSFGNYKYKKAIKTIDSSIDKLSKSTEIKGTNSLLPLFSQFMSPKELRDQLATFYFAGQETTNSTLLWTIYYLAKFPEYQDRVRNEVLNKWSLEKDITVNDLDGFTFLNAVIQESMRLSPAAFLIFRNIEQDIELRKYELKKNSLVMVSVYGTHRHPDIWDEPTKFIPERFLENKNKGYSYFPYGGGKRICIGMHLARMEIATIVALFVAQFKFELMPGLEIQPKVSMTLQPNKKIKLALL